MIVLDIDPNVVRPGWTPLIITVLLAIVMFFLYRSMKRQFGRIQHLPTEADAAAARLAARNQTSTGSAGSTTAPAPARNDAGRDVRDDVRNVVRDAGPTPSDQPRSDQPR